MKLESTTARYMSEKDMWQKNLESIEESWTCKPSQNYSFSCICFLCICIYDDLDILVKYGTLEAQKVEHSGDQMQKELDDLKQQYEKLKVSCTHVGNLFQSSLLQTKVLLLVGRA